MTGAAIAGYTFGDETYCPTCLYGLFQPVDRPADPDQPTEELLDSIAQQHGLNRRELNTYTSYDFPQPLSREQVTETDSCVICLRRLLDVSSKR